MRVVAAGGAVAAVAASLWIGAAAASATTICVPAFGSGCPDSGGNLAVTDVEQAMSTQAADGQADEIVIAPGTYVEKGGFEPAGGSPGTYEATGSDPLAIVGAGRAQTILTSEATGNVFVANLDFNNTRQISMRHLTVRAPASLDDGLGATIQLSGDTLEDVAIVSLNPGTDGVLGAGSGNVVRGGEVRGEGSGSIDYGVGASSTGASVLVEDEVVRGAGWGLVTTASSAVLVARRVAVRDAGAYGAVASPGSMTVENSTITTESVGLFGSAAASPATLAADHVTVVAEGSSYPALEAKKFSSSPGSVALSVSNSVLRGFASGYKAETPFGPGVGTVSIEARYSNIKDAGANTNGRVDLSAGNIEADPLLAPNFSLQAGSPSIDAGDPAAGGLDDDLLGAPRPADGDGDCAARRDQGAFEYQLPPPPACVPPAPAGPAGASDTTPPRTKIVAGPGKLLASGVARFRFRSSEPGSTFRCRLDRRRAVRCRSPRRYRGLRRGPHVFKAWAVDSAGNMDSTPAKRRFRVPTPS